MSALRVAVDAHNLLTDWRGIARYVRAVLVRLAARDDVELTLLTHRRLFARRALRRVLAGDRFRTARRVPRDADVVWHPWNGTFFASDRPAVVTVHDAVPFAFPAAGAARRHSEQEPWRRSAAGARAFLANSRFTADEAERYLGIDPARVTVTPLAVEREHFNPAGPRAALPDGRRFVLYAGADEPRKNVATLAAAHARAFPNGEVALAAAGDAPAQPGVVALGRLEPAQLAAWYRGALAVAVPSLYEGFGFPLLEAMACGTAVAATRATSLPEVGGDAPLWIDAPLDVDAWAAALRALAGDDTLRARHAADGVRRAATFSWDTCANATLGVLRDAARQPA